MKARSHPAKATIIGVVPGAIFLLLSICASAWALNSSLDVSQYAHTAWRIREGFVSSTIHQIAQTPAGYLWLAIESGLYRFDGVRAVPWSPPPGRHLPSNDIRSIVAGRDGILWLGTAKGLISWKSGMLTEYPPLDFVIPPVWYQTGFIAKFRIRTDRVKSP
ncbi:MAG: two-component regulator propeller domain-containing protein, partial [Silvibacterium sp.]